MGLRSSCQIFESVSDAISWIASDKFGIYPIVKVLDDFLFMAPTVQLCTRYLQGFTSMCTSLGVPLAPEKTEGPSTTLTFLGIELDTCLMEARLPPDKLEKCSRKISEALSAKKNKIKLRELQQLLGLLNFVCQVVTPGRCFLRRLHNLTIGCSNPHYYVRIGTEARKDLRAWQFFLASFNGKSMIKYQPWVSSDCLHLFTDSVGFGALFQSHWVYGLWPDAWHTKGISFLELYPIMISLSIWGISLRNKRIILHTDNQALEPIINSATSKNSEIMILVRRIVFTTMEYNIQIKAKYLPGKDNLLPDLLSRSQISRFQQEAPWADTLPTPVPLHLQPLNLSLT